MRNCKGKKIIQSDFQARQNKKEKEGKKEGKKEMTISIQAKKTGKLK